MKDFLIVILVALIPAGEALAAPGFSWFHTRPKPVLLNDENTAGRKSVAYHGTAMYPNSGRLYFKDGSDNTRNGRAASQSRSRVTTVFSSGSHSASAAKTSQK